MPAAPTRPPIRQLILVPAIITLAVTLLRLVGELQFWMPALFSREGGGAGALVGIVWLVPIFGVWFALKLDRAGQGPASRGRAIGFAAAGLVLLVGLVALAFKTFDSAVTRVLAVNASMALCGAIAYRGWPRLGRVHLAYGLAVRIPVALLMLIAMHMNWGTHYELGMPGLPPLDFFPRWLLIGLLPQMVTWIGFTVLVGGLCGSVALLFRRKSEAKGA